MAIKIIQLKRGTDAQRQLVTPLVGEAIWTTDLKQLWIGDGTTAGGIQVGGGSSGGGLQNDDSSTGDYSTTGHLISGRGSGGVALTINDGYGNANVTWNHENGIPEQAGNAGRIIVNTDATSGAYMQFELKSNVSAAAAQALTNCMKITETGVLDYESDKFGTWELLYNGASKSVTGLASSAYNKEGTYIIQFGTSSTQSAYGYETRTSILHCNPYFQTLQGYSQFGAATLLGSYIAIPTMRGSASGEFQIANYTWSTGAYVSTGALHYIYKIYRLKRY